MADWIVGKLPCPYGSTYTVGLFNFCSLKWKSLRNFAFPSLIIPMKKNKIRDIKKKEAIFSRKDEYIRLKVTTLYKELYRKNI